MQNVRNYYEILGVSKNAPADEIKQAYRTLARRYHPDRNPGNKAAEEKFKDINEAYEILSDQTRRLQYDSQNKKVVGGKNSVNPFDGFGRNKPATRQTPTNRPGERIDSMDYRPERIKRERIVTPTRPTRRDIEAKLTLPLNKAYRGGREKIRLEDGRSLEVEMPAGAIDGQRIRLRGQGIEGGNLYLKITVARHPFFELQEANIYCQVPITPTEAVLGGDIEIPTLDGLVKVTLPQGVRSGQRLRLANKGYITKEGDRGDQLVELQIVTSKEISDSEKELYEKLRTLETFNPRKNMIKNI
jgi:curved DNA-binding protein